MGFRWSIPARTVAVAWAAVVVTAVSNASVAVGDANARVAQRSQVSIEIANHITVVHQAAGQIAGGREEVQATVVGLSKLAGTLRETVLRFQV